MADCRVQVPTAALIEHVRHANVYWEIYFRLRFAFGFCCCFFRSVWSFKVLKLCANLFTNHHSGPGRIFPLSFFVVFIVNFPFCRFLAQKLIYSFTPKFICAKPNHTSVRSVQRLLPIPAICRSTHASIWESNRIVAKFVSANLLNCRICSNTFVRTPATSRINAVTLAARKHFHNCPICNRTQDATKRTNRTSVIRVINAFRMNHRCLSTYQSTKNRNTWKRTFANIAANRTHKKRI